MKKTLLILCTGFLSFVANSQWSNGGGPPSSWGNGASGPVFTQWRSFGFGNFAGNGATPQARVHINEFYLLNPWTGTNGNLFRTDGNNTVDNNWRMFTGPTAVGATEKFRITSLPLSNQMELGAVQNGSLHFMTNNIRRVTILPFATFPYNRTGFVGLNDQNPRFHLDINTQNPDGIYYGELMLRARITDDPLAYISFVNIATTGPFLAPALLGRQSNNAQAALNTVGSINNNQDIATNIQPITKFFSVINYDPTGGPVSPPLSFDRSNVVENRRLFGWYNGVDQLMTMESNGFLGIGINNPGNRVEINSDFYDLNTGGPLGMAPNGPSVTESTDNGQPGLGATNATGFSGLRFSDLTSNSNPLLQNPGPGVLALDENGDIVYVQSISNGFVECSDNSGAANLLSDSKINLNNQNFYFENNDILNENHVGIGYDCSQFLPAKLSARQIHPFSVNENTTAIIGLNNDITNTILTTYTGVEGIADGVHPPLLRTTNRGGAFFGSGADVNYGVYAEAKKASTENWQNIGGSFIGTDGIVSIGIWGTGRNGELRSVGVSGQATSPNSVGNPPSTLENIGGQFVGSYSNGTNYGVKGVANFGNTAIGIYGTASGATTDWAGYFDGNVYVSGTFGPSDELLKENIEELSFADSILNLLNPVTFDFKTDEFPQFHLSEVSQMGLIAQDVESIIPTIVNTNNSPAQYDSLGNELYPSIEFKSIDYSKLIPLLVAGHKEQTAVIDSMATANDSLQAQLDDLNNRLTQLENCLSNLLPTLCQANQMAIQQTPEETQEYLERTINVTLSGRNNIILNQNVPNPFAESTVITYTIPATVQKAQIHFYDGQGKLINSVDITERGNGQLNVFANDLSTGVYTYSLVADGKIVATKKMMKQ